MKTICPQCYIEYEVNTREYNKSISNNRKIYCSSNCYMLSRRKRKKPRICPKCGKLHFKLKYCSRICSNSHTQTEEQNLSRSIKVKRWQKKNRKYLPLTKAQELRWTSVGEREIRKYFIDKFPCDDWTYGYFKRIGVATSLDLYSEKLKVIIEYDGIWHFKNIKGQLKHKQAVDKRLEIWVINNNWRLIRIREEIYKANKLLWIFKLVDAAYKRTEQVLKFY